MSDHFRHYPDRIQCKDTHGNTVYVYRPIGCSWSCALADGTSCSFSFATGNPDAMLTKFRLDDCETVEQAADVLQEHAGPNTKRTFTII